ncbi:glycosyltransferase [Bizionia sediminis]|uniref:Glycosyltransferase n=1 Tax=Bizionia sediminis TaxID=1737064 RepID=A0ABW5KRF9_9FLAO
MITKNKLLIIGAVWPEPKSSAAGSRMMQLIALFRAQQYNILFATATSKTDNAHNLAAEGINTVPIKLNDASFDEFIKKEQPDIVLFDRFITEEQYGWRVSEQCPNALLILDTEDLHGLRKARELAFKVSGNYRDFLANSVAKREIASIYRCDLSLIISEAEMNLLHTYFKVPSNLLFYVPFMLDEVTIKKQKAIPSFHERMHFVTVGNFFHKPNYQAVWHLKKHIWPGIKQQLSQAELHIYGAYADQKVKQLHNEQTGFLVKGFVSDINQAMQKARVCLAPLQFGAGLKGKLIDAMINGTPAIMSSIAAEGMFGSLKPNGYIADQPDLFIAKAVALYNNVQDWHVMQKNGYEVINTRFNAHLFNTHLLETIASLQINLALHREANFTGSLLQHQSMQAAKFMSKWIELKNATSTHTS